MEMPAEGVREFKLEIDTPLIPIHTQTRPHFNNTKLQDGLYFNSVNQLKQREVMVIYDEYNDIIKSAAQAIINFWRGNVEHYFNRRAYGMVVYGNDFDTLFNTKGIALDKSDYVTPKGFLKRPTTGRGHTHCMKNALKIETINHAGATFYVKPCMRERDGSDARDYIEILMTGASGGPPYHPNDDKRYYDNTGRTWQGIPDSYWMNWQADFITFINKKEHEANSLILDLLKHYGVIGTGVAYNQYTKTERQTTRINPKTGQPIVPAYTSPIIQGGLRTRPKR